MAYNIDTDRLIDLLEKEIVHPILKHKCSKAFQVGYEKGLAANPFVTEMEAVRKDRYHWKVAAWYYRDKCCTLERKWIPVSERLPEKDKEVLCLTDTGSYWLAMFNRCDDGLWSDGEFWSSKKFVTHWMPLPQPPKGE